MFLTALIFLPVLECAACKGVGVFMVQEKAAEYSMEDCPTCKGKGKIPLLTRVRLRIAK